MAAKRLYIVDVMAMAFRSFFAFARNPLSTKQGLQTSALFGSAMFLNKLINDEKPDYLAAAMESREPSVRHKVYREYKAHRDRMPDGLGEQLPHIFELLERMTIPVITHPGYEADDVVGSLVRRFAGPKLDVRIVSGDKDFMQLINKHVFLFVPRKNEQWELIDEQGVYEKFHCRPDQMVDCLALMGDTSDNVPGVPGIGEKTAAKLIETHGSLASIYENIESISAKKVKESLIQHRDDAMLSRELVTIVTDLPLKVDLEDLKCDPAKAAANPALIALYDEFEFRQLAAKAREALGEEGEAPHAAPAKVKKAPAPVCLPVKSADEWSACLKVLQMASRLYLHPLGRGSDIVTEAPRALALATDEQLFLIPLDKQWGQTLDQDKMRHNLQPILTNPKVSLVGHDLKFDWQILNNWGIRLGNALQDLMVADYLIDPNHADHSLLACVERHLGKSIATSIKTGFLHANGLTPEDEERLGHTVQLLRELREAMAPKLERLQLNRVFETVEMPLISVLAEMEQQGVFIDTDLLNEFSHELDTQVKTLQKDIHKLAGEEFNINSTKKLQEILFQKLKVQDSVGLKRLKKTKTGLSTDESVLSQLREHPLVDKILDYREVVKLKNTYVDPFPQFVHYKTHRLHTRFRQTVTATGRLSSENPNLQNIPMQSKLGQKIRKAFRAQKKDHVIISADYTQIEIRLLAHLAQEEHLIEAFKKGLDIHRATASRIFGVPLEEVTPTLRGRAKAVNFGIIYGMGPQRLARDTGVTMTEAKDFIARYFEAYPGIKKFTEGLIRKAKQEGYSETVTGRRRPILGLGDANRAVVARAENIAVNAPIQGSAADLIKLAMICIQKRFQEEKVAARMLLQIHDELLFEAPKKELAQVKSIIKECMEGAMESSVPLEVSIGTGENWLEAH